MEKIHQFLFRQIPIDSLAFFRIGFGIIAFAEAIGHFGFYHLWENWYDPTALHFTYYGFEWVKPFPEPLLTIFLLVHIFLAIAIILGWRYHLTCFLYALGATYVFLMEKALYLNHGYLFCQLSFVMALLPANRSFSLDVLRKPKIFRKTIPFYPIFLLCFLMGIVYFYGGIAKINSDWLQAIPLKQWVGYRRNMPILGWIWDQEIVAWILAYGGMLFDLFIVAFLIWRRTRPYAFIVVILFHLTNHIIFLIGIFPYMSTLLSALYFPPTFPRNLLDWLEKRIPKVGQWRTTWANTVREKLEPAVSNTALIHSPQINNRIFWVIALFACFHLAMPWRHYYFPGDVTWTEEGHRYSWRMMLRSKQGKGYFLVLGDDKKKERIFPAHVIEKYRMARKLLTHPDMILQYAHYLKDQKEKEGWKNVEVYAHITANMNYRSFYPFIDGTVDLTKEKWHFFKSSPWILPYPAEE